MITDNYTLLLRTGPQDLAAKTNECSVIDTITDKAAEWTRNKRFQGGADVGTFKIYGEANQLGAFFQTWLGLDILEIDQGIPTWNGQIRRVELHAGSVGIARDMNLMYNKVIVLYENDDGVVLRSTERPNNYSIAMYGAREEQVTGLLTNSTDADHQAYYILSLHGWPPRFPCASIQEPGAAPFLMCYVNGYIHSLNDKYAPYDEPFWTRPVDNIDVDDAIEDIIDDSDYINIQRIGSNNIEVWADDGEGQRAGDYLNTLLEITDTSRKMFHGWVDNTRQFYYESVDFTPSYYIKGGRVYADSGATVLVAPRHISPGIFRVLDLPIKGDDESSIFEDRRDVLIEDISIDPSGMPAYSPLDSPLSEYTNFTQSVKRWERQSLSRPPAFPGWDEIEEMYQERISGDWKTGGGPESYTTGWSTGGV